jgi:membrane fusion protein (multidrug efflux system)
MCMPGQVISIAARQVWVLANYKETQLTRVAIGQRAEIRVGTFRDRGRRDMSTASRPASGCVQPAAAGQ